ncbi:MAG: DNA repair protein RecO [Eubacteriales bacterium]|nr:DNA repair protein RecO [Eubacteriales bacterium]
MQHVTVKGLVIRETDFGEADRFLTVLTEELGKIEVLCRGIRRRRGSLANAVRLFSYSELTLYASGRRYTLNDASVEMPFWSITSDIERYALCCYLAELAGIAAEEDTATGELLPMFLRALYAMDRQNRPVQIVKPAFELRLASLLGFTPDLLQCGACGATEFDEGASFLIEDGRLMCMGCRRRVGGTYYDLTPGMLAAMRHILFCEGKKLYAFQMNEQTAAALGALCEKYLLYHLDERCPTLEFYHSLFPTGDEVSYK